MQGRPNHLIFVPKIGLWKLPGNLKGETLKRLDCGEIKNWNHEM